LCGVAIRKSRAVEKPQGSAV
jgi:hypothetical protein